MQAMRPLHAMAARLWSPGMVAAATAALGSRDVVSSREITRVCVGSGSHGGLCVPA